GRRGRRPRRCQAAESELVFTVYDRLVGDYLAGQVAGGSRPVPCRARGGRRGIDPGGRVTFRGRPGLGRGPLGPRHPRGGPGREPFAGEAHPRFTGGERFTARRPGTVAEGFPCLTSPRAPTVAHPGPGRWHPGEA